MKLCYLYFPQSMFGTYFAHDLVLFVVLLILFMIPLCYQYQRTYRINNIYSTAKCNQIESRDSEYDEYSSYYNISKDKTLTDDKKIHNQSPPKQSTYKNQHMHKNENISIFRRSPKNSMQNVSSELHHTLIRNGVGGLISIMMATFFLTTFYFASNRKHEHDHEKGLWSSGFMLFGNLVRYFVLYACMTISYKDYLIMFFPFCSSKWRKNTDLRVY